MQETNPCLGGRREEKEGRERGRIGEQGERTRGGMEGAHRSYILRSIGVVNPKWELCLNFQWLWSFSVCTNFSLTLSYLYFPV